MFQGRPIFDDEAVNRSVIHREVPQSLNIAPYVIDGLSRQAVHQIDRQVADAGLPGSIEGLLPFFCRVNAAQKGQHLIGKRLDAQTQAVDAAGHIGLGLFPVEAFRVGFDRNFGIPRDRKGLTQGPYDGLHGRCRQDGRRAAADVDRIDGLSGIRRGRNFPTEGRHVACHIAVKATVRRKIAVQAFMAAKGDVNVDAEHYDSSTLRTAMKASCGISTVPNCFIRFLPSFCFSRSLRLREMSPP